MKGDATNKCERDVEQWIMRLEVGAIGGYKRGAAEQGRVNSLGMCSSTVNEAESVCEAGASYLWYG